MELYQQLEAVLFYKGEPETTKTLAKVLSVSEDEVLAAAAILKEKLADHGLVLMQNQNELELRTGPSASALIEQLRKQELSKDLGRAGAETLAIVLYKGPVTRSEIDYIRGVNSSFILRNLLIRGLVERTNNPNDARAHHYQVSMELLAHLGVADSASLPEYDVIQRELESFVKQADDDTTE